MNKIILINKENKIKSNYINKINLVSTKDIDNEEVLVEEETFKNYLNLKEFLDSIGVEIGISSAYRSVEKQQEIYDEFLIKYGREYRDRVVALPKTSEHHTGLALDICIKIDGVFPDDNNILETQKKYYEEIHKYLKNFGFILRYPKGKENITGYNYEPWHIRYVGIFVANIIYNNNLTLEEYVKDFNGLICVNKEKGMTSFDVVNEISHLFGIKRVGHTGTLDPMAEGVLIVAIGKATKVVELITSTYKEYIAEAQLGIKTDTKDITGNIIETTNNIDTSNLEKVLQNFKKTYLQEVPIYSAVKVNGKKLYEYARNNEKVQLPKKEVTIKEIELLNIDNNKFTFRAVVSKGCYIRSLIDDIGNALGIYATMTKLIRTKQAGVTINDCYTLKQIKNNNYRLYSIDELLDYPIEIVNEYLEFKIRNGQKLKNTFNVKEKVIFKNISNKLIGIYENVNNELKVWKNF